MFEVDVCIRYWLYVLDLNNWNIETERISREQVVFPEDIKIHEKYYVGISCDFKAKEAILYHDRIIAEEDILHELLHIKFRNFSEKNINILTKAFLNASNTEYPDV